MTIFHYFLANTVKKFERLIELPIKYHKIGVFVFNFAKLKVSEQPRLGFRNLKLRTIE